MERQLRYPILTDKEVWTEIYRVISTLLLKYSEIYDLGIIIVL